MNLMKSRVSHKQSVCDSAGRKRRRDNTSTLARRLASTVYYQ